MSDSRPWWTGAVQWTLFFAVMALLMGWLGRTRQRTPERSTRGIVLRNPPSVLGLGVVGTMLFAALAVAVLLTASDGSGPIYLAFFTGFALMGLSLVADYYIDRFEIRDDGFTFRTKFGGSGTAAWTDVTEVRYSHRLKWFSIRLQNGVIVRVSIMMVGLPVLADHLLARATNARVDQTSRRVLTDTASGNLPTLWT